MIKTTFRDQDDNTVQFASNDSDTTSEVTFIKRDLAARFLSHECFLYSSGKLQEWASFNERGELISKHVMEYGPGDWDAWCREFDRSGVMLKQTFFTWDTEYGAKAAMFYDSNSTYQKKRVDTLKEGRYYPISFDREGRLISSDGAA